MAHAVVDLEAALLTPEPISKTGIDARSNRAKTRFGWDVLTVHNTQYNIIQYEKQTKYKYFAFKSDMTLNTHIQSLHCHVTTNISITVTGHTTHIQ